MTSWLQLFPMALWNLNRLRTRFGPVIALYLVGYIVTLTALLIVVGVTEADYIASIQAYGGNPRMTYVFEPHAESTFDYTQLMADWLAVPEVDRVLLAERSPRAVNWAGYTYRQNPTGVVSLLAGRWFSRDELAEGQPIALVGRVAAESLTGTQPIPGQFIQDGGRQLKVIGLLSPTMPTTGYTSAYADRYVWVPMKVMLEHLQSGTPTDLRAYIYTNRPLTANESKLLLGDAARRSGPAAAFHLDLAADKLSGSAWYTSLLLSMVIGGALTLFAVLNLSALARYWIRRRRYELGVRLGVGASIRDVARLLTLEQGVLLLIAYGGAVLIFILLHPLIIDSGLKTAFSPRQLLLTGILALLVLRLTHALMAYELRRHPITYYLRKAVL